MPELYTIGELKPLSNADVSKIEDHNEFILPEDFKAFLLKFGYGDINELLMIAEPDEEYISSNFSDCMDLWDWQEVDEQLVVNGLTIGKTINGDIIVLIKKQDSPIVLLPRNSDKPLFFSDFNSVIEYYNEKYKFNDNLYFDTDYNFKIECINVTTDGKSGENNIRYIHEKFLKQVSVDNAFNLDIQPKYVIQSIGGWVYFDLVSGSTIRVKYQDQCAKQAGKIIGNINETIKNIL